MIIYLFKFSLSLFLFYAFYKMVLENDKSFHFNRFLLVSGILISTVVPKITLGSSVVLKSYFLQIPPYIPTNYNFWENLLLIVYSVGIAFYGIRLILDLLTFFKKIKQNQKINIGDSHAILVNEKVEPHAFLNYIFINKEDFNFLPRELLDHELAHVRQLHTFDLFMMEIAKVIFWFNPLINSYKNAIQLNHEFLADQYVIKQHKDHSQYQNLLLSHLEKRAENSLSSHFNYSFIQKRLLMMRNQSSSQNPLRKLLIIPFLGLILISCTDNKGVSGKEMLEYWRYTANLEEILVTGKMNDKDLKEGIVIPIENKSQYNRVMDIYTRMNHTQKKSVYKIPSFMEPIK